MPDWLHGPIAGATLLLLLGTELLRASGAWRRAVHWLELAALVTVLAFAVVLLDRIAEALAGGAQ